MNNAGAASGIGFLDALLLIFIVLKLIGIITWSWWVVLIPLWIEIILVIVFIIIIIIGNIARSIQ